MIMIDWDVDNLIEDFWNTVYVDEVENEAQDFSIEELAYIGLINNEGSKLYMHNESSGVRERVFELITGRESRYYQHTGIWFWETWKEVEKGTESGFFKGEVLSEADINFSWEIYKTFDVFTMLTVVAQCGALVIAVVLVVKATPAIVANIQAITYYVKTYGVKNGLNMYLIMGSKNLPDGVITWIQMDMADGDSSLDDTGAVVAKGTLTGKLDGLTQAERTMVDDLLNSGKNVEIIPRSDVAGVKTPDFLVNGVKTELKTLTGTSLNTPLTRIQNGFKQGAETVIIDARNTGLTLGQANTIMERAAGKYGGTLPGNVEIWTIEGIIKR